MEMKNRIRELENRLANYEYMEHYSLTEIPDDESFGFENDFDKNQEERHDDGLKFSEPVCSQQLFLESGSSDLIILKLSEVHGKDISPNNTSPNSLEIREQQKVHIPNELLRKLPTDFVFKMIEETHFYLTSIYLPFELEELIAKIQECCSEGYLQLSKLSNNSLRPLILVLLGLGQHYTGIKPKADIDIDAKEDTTCLPFFMSGICEIFPIKDINDVELVVVFIVCSYYFRAVNEDRNAILYSNFGIVLSLQLALHSGSSYNGLSEVECEKRCRIWWSAFSSNRFLCVKLGHPLILNLSQITAPYPKMLSTWDGKCTKSTFPNSDDLKHYIELSKISEEITNNIYLKRSSDNGRETNLKSFMEPIFTIIQRLVNWNKTLTANLRLNLHERKQGDGKEKRLKYSVHLNCCYLIHLSTVPVLYQLVLEQITCNQNGEKWSIKDLSQDLMTVLTVCFNAAVLTFNILSICYEETTLAIHGVLDPDYLYSASLTFAMGMILEPNEEFCTNFQSCLKILKHLTSQGNPNAKAKLLKIESFISSIDGSALKSYSNASTEFELGSESMKCDKNDIDMVIEPCMLELKAFFK
ncbi:uncharacterized protein PRCAT00005133001 [Priceomyces carsonii]|uniref:uncharacterized protein n=1 Tax=Priceomyces carsonii TaxID=28549 RepID=UPI002EDB5146|nr:unnamed protein product [Priceomyces carsonii]